MKVFRLTRGVINGRRCLLGVDPQGRILGLVWLPGPAESLRWPGLADKTDMELFTRETGLAMDENCQ